MQNLLVRFGLIGVTFGTGIIVARSLAPVGRGEQAALALWPALFTGLATFGVPTALNFLSRRQPEASGRLLSVALLAAVALGSLAALVGIVTIPLVLHGYDNQVITDARWLMLFAPQFVALFVVRAHLEAQGEYTRSILGQLIPTIVTLAALIVLRSTHSLSPTTAVLCYFIPGALWTFWTIAQIWSRIVVSVDTFRDDLRSLGSYGIRCYGTDIIVTLSAQVDLAIIVAFLSPVSLGIYSVSLTLARLLNVVQQSLVAVIFPHASGMEPDAAVFLVGRSARLAMILSSLLGAVLLMVVPFLLPLVYGSAFAKALTIMPLLTAEAILAGVCNVLVQAFLATGRPAIVSAIQGGWLTSAVVLLMLLVPRINLTGAALALLGASLIRLGLVAAAYRIVLHRMLPSLWPSAEDIEVIRTKVKLSARGTGGRDITIAGAVGES